MLDVEFIFVIISCIMSPKNPLSAGHGLQWFRMWGQSNSSHHLTAPCVQQWGLQRHLPSDSWWILCIDHKQNGLFRTCNKGFPNFVLLHTYTRISKLAGICEKIAHDARDGLPSAHVTLVNNYATPRSKDRLSSINLLRTPNWVLPLYVATSVCSSCWANAFFNHRDYSDTLPPRKDVLWSKCTSNDSLNL